MCISKTDLDVLLKYIKRDNIFNFTDTFFFTYLTMLKVTRKNILKSSVITICFTYIPTNYYFSKLLVPTLLSEYYYQRQYINLNKFIDFRVQNSN